MRVTVDGWAHPVGTAHDVRVMEQVFEQGVTWRPIHIGRMVLSHAAYMLLLQGLPQSRFFLGSCLQTPAVFEDALRFEPPLYLLGLRPTPVWRVPYTLERVMLAELLEPKLLPQEALVQLIPKLVSWYFYWEANDRRR